MPIVIYTRAGCRLCDEAKEMLRTCRQRHVLSMEEIDVDADPALKALYGERVPVLEVHGRVRMWGKWNRVLLERTLAAEGH